MQSGMKLRSTSSSKARFCARRRWSSNTSPVLGLFGSLIAMTVRLDLTHRLDAASLSPPAGSAGYPGPGRHKPGAARPGRGRGAGAPRSSSSRWVVTLMVERRAPNSQLTLRPRLLRPLPPLSDPAMMDQCVQRSDRRAAQRAWWRERWACRSTVADRDQDRDQSGRGVQRRGAGDRGLHFANIAVFTVALYAAIAALMRASCRPESVLIS
jgi:hypothetical protein